MGRASRKTAPQVEHWTETHPDRHLWSPGRLAIARTQTKDEYEALYGRSQEAAESGRLRSAFCLNTEILEKLQRRPLSGEERIEFLSHIDADFLQKSGLDELQRDQAFQKLFEDEWNGLPRPIREKLQDVQSEMEEFFAEAVRVFAQSQRIRDAYEDPAQDLAPSSLLGSALRSGEIDGRDLADNMNLDFALEILPQLEYIRRLDAKDAPNDFLRKMWQEFWQASGSRSNQDVEGRLAEIDQFMQSAFGGTFDRYFGEEEIERRCRVYRNVFYHIGGERNLGQLFRESIASDSLGPAADHAVRRALAKEIERIFILHEDSSDYFEETMRAVLKERKSRALEALQPLFKHKEHLLQEAEDCIAKADIPSSQIAETISRAIWKGCERRDFQEDFHETILLELQR